MTTNTQILTEEILADLRIYRAAAEADYADSPEDFRPHYAGRTIHAFGLSKAKRAAARKILNQLVKDGVARTDSNRSGATTWFLRTEADVAAERVEELNRKVVLEALQAAGIDTSFGRFNHRVELSINEAAALLRVARFNAK